MSLTILTCAVLVFAGTATHLYEIGEPLKQYPNIIFNYFETAVQDDQLVFNYQLKEGISNDRLGYLILKREGVVDMLEKL